MVSGPTAPTSQPPSIRSRRSSLATASLRVQLKPTPAEQLRRCGSTTGEQTGPRHRVSTLNAQLSSPTALSGIGQATLQEAAKRPVIGCANTHTSRDTWTIRGRYVDATLHPWLEDRWILRRGGSRVSSPTLYTPSTTTSSSHALPATPRPPVHERAWISRCRERGASRGLMVFRRWSQSVQLRAPVSAKAAPRALAASRARSVRVRAASTFDKVEQVGGAPSRHMFLNPAPSALYPTKQHPCALAWSRTSKPYDGSGLAAYSKQVCYAPARSSLLAGAPVVTAACLQAHATTAGSGVQ